MPPLAAALAEAAGEAAKELAVEADGLGAAADAAPDDGAAETEAAVAGAADEGAAAVDGESEAVAAPPQLAITAPMALSAMSCRARLRLITCGSNELVTRSIVTPLVVWAERRMALTLQQGQIFVQ